MQTQLYVHISGIHCTYKCRLLLAVASSEQLPLVVTTVRVQREGEGALTETFSSKLILIRSTSHDNSTPARLGSVQPINILNSKHTLNKNTFLQGVLLLQTEQRAAPAASCPPSSSCLYPCPPPPGEGTVTDQRTIVSRLKGALILAETLVHMTLPVETTIETLNQPVLSFARMKPPPGHISSGKMHCCLECMHHSEYIRGNLAGPRNFDMNQKPQRPGSQK